MPWMNQSDHQLLIRTQKMRTIANFTPEMIFQQNQIMVCNYGFLNKNPIFTRHNTLSKKKFNDLQIDVSKFAEN